MTDLTKAIADLKTLQSEPWDELDFGSFLPDRALSIVTVLNAIASGELVPASERDAAVAAALEEAVGLCEARAKRRRAEAVVVADPDIHIEAAGALENAAKSIRALINQPQADHDARILAAIGGVETCSDCGGSGLSLDFNGEPTHCRVCKGDAVVPIALNKEPKP